MALPILYDIPIEMCDNIVKECSEQDVAKQTEEAEGKEKAVKPHVWQELRELLSRGRGSSPRLLGGTDRGHDRIMDKTLRHAVSVSEVESQTRRDRIKSVGEKFDELQHEDMVLRGDMRAKDKLIMELQEKRDALLEENEKLKFEKKHGYLSKKVAHLRHWLGGDSDDEHGKDEDEQENNMRDKTVVDMPSRTLDEGETWLSGAFA